MGLGLTLMTGLGSLPILLFLWFSGTALGVVWISEALERTRGLVPSTYGGAFWLSCVFVVLVVLVEIGTWFAPRTDGNRRSGCLATLLTQPSAAALLLFLPCVSLVRCDLGGTDVPDILTSTLLLCVLGYGLFVLPIAFVSLALRLARWLWRFGQRSSFRSGLVAGVATVIGALLPTCAVCSPPNPDAEETNARLGEVFERGAEYLGEEIDRKGLLEGSLAALTHTATVIPGTTGPWKFEPPEAQFEARLRSCVHKLTGAASRVATVEKAARLLVSTRRADIDTANAVAYGTVYRVCLRHARDPLDNLDSYFLKSVKQNYCRDHGRNVLAQCSEFDTVEASCDIGYPYSSPGQIDAAIDLRARLCRLSERDRSIVLREFAGETSDQLAGVFDMTPAAVRKALERAYKKMAAN